MRFFHTLFLPALCAVLCFSIAFSVSAATPEQVRAVMIRKFAEFVNWPDEISPRKDMHLRVCIYGDSSMMSAADIFARTSANASMKFSLSMRSSLDNITGACHILFIASSKQDQLSSILSGLQNLPVVTVSDMNGFVDRGGMVGFQTVDGSIRYNINNKSFGEAKLRVDAQLLEIANKVVE